MAAGVAKVKAQGQVTMSTDTATIKACAGETDQASQALNTAANNTASKKGLAMRSAKMAKRGLCKEALCIKSTICANRVEAPTCVTSTRTVWLTLCEPAITDSPILRRKGLDSPVSKASSTKVSPSMRLASAGKISPGRTSKTSPIRTSSVATTSND